MRFFVQISLVFCIVLLILPSITTTLAREVVTAEDWTRHLPWILRYAHGDFTPFFEYPPAFHLIMLLPVMLLGDSVRYFQIVFALLCTGSILYFVWRTSKDKQSVMIAAFCLASSTLYLLMSQALIAQVVDYVLFPWVCLFMFDRKYKVASALLLIQMYTHSVGIFFLGALFLFALLARKDLIKYLVVVTILSLPVFLFSNFGATVNQTLTSGPYLNEWELQFLWPPAYFFFRSGYLIWLILPYAIYLMRKKGLTERRTLFSSWIVAFTPLVLYDPFRWLSYIIIPLILLEADLLRSEGFVR